MTFGENQTHDEERTVDLGPPVVQGLCGLRLICENSAVFAASVEFYRNLLGRDADEWFGAHDDVQQSALWRLEDGLDLVLAREPEPLPEAYIDQGRLWLCFASENPDGVHAAALERGLEILNDPTDTGFGTRAFYLNDPNGLPVYVGGDWK